MIRNFFRKLMYGRYGPDQLYLCMLIVSVLLLIGSRFCQTDRLTVLYMALIVLAYLLLALAVFRFFSRKIERRRKENAAFLRIWHKICWKVKRVFGGGDKTHKYFRCPSCRNTLRLPKGKGKIQITCPKCGQRFIKKT